MSPSARPTASDCIQADFLMQSASCEFPECLSYFTGSIPVAPLAARQEQRSRRNAKWIAHAAGIDVASAGVAEPPAVTGQPSTNATEWNDAATASLPPQITRKPRGCGTQHDTKNVRDPCSTWRHIVLPPQQYSAEPMPVDIPAVLTLCMLHRSLG